jgi:hypothetical protein
MPSDFGLVKWQDCSLGFTGTQQGMTKDQKEMVDLLLWNFLPKIVNHGDCIGADAEFHDLCCILKEKRKKKDIPDIHIWPPDKAKKRKFCEGYAELHPEAPYLERNRSIVEHSRIMIAAPKETEETLRSGTWSTIRYSVQTRTPTIIVWPDGRFDLPRTRPKA